MLRMVRHGPDNTARKRLLTLNLLLVKVSSFSMAAEIHTLQQGLHGAGEAGSCVRTQV